jgi:hypothetical protein
MIAAGSGCCLRPLGVVMNEQHCSLNLFEPDFAASTQQFDISLFSVHLLRTLVVEFMRFRQ